MRYINDNNNDDMQLGFMEDELEVRKKTSYIEESEDLNVTTLYNKLRSQDKEYFKRVVRMLLSGSYCLQMDYDAQTGLFSRNADYIFIASNYDLLYLYFEMGGFTLVKDTDNGLFALENEADEARFHFNLNTTRIALALRCIYQKKYTDISSQDRIMTDVAEVVQFLKDNVNVDITSNKMQMAADFKTLSSFRIIEKGSGEWKDASTVFRITPAILHLVSTGKVTELLSKIDEESSIETDKEIGND